jgi:outer membrane protein TolC
MEVLDKNIANLRKTLTEVRAIHEKGFAEKLDVERLELSLNNLNAEREKITRLMEIGRNFLKFQMGYPMDQEILLSDQFDQQVGAMTVENIDVSAKIDFGLRPEYVTINLAEELTKINIRRYRVGYFPTLYAFGSHQQNLQRNNLFDNDENPWFGVTVVGLSLNVPIFDGLDKRAKIQRARILLDKTQLQKQDFERAVTLEVRNARTAFLNARQSVETTKNSLDLAQKIYDTTQAKFRGGVGSSMEVAQAEREFYAAQANYTNALYDLLVAKTDLDKALGRI